MRKLLYTSFCVAAILYAQIASASPTAQDWGWVGQRMWDIYAKKPLLSFGSLTVEEIAKTINYDKFGGVNPYCEEYFGSKPLVAFAGQFSTGKTTMIEEVLLGERYPASNVAPNPSTDTFTLIRSAAETQATLVEKGRSVASGPFMQYLHLGDGFLQSLTSVQLKAPILQHVSLLDTPGILSGAAEDTRAYDVVHAWQMIAAHADMVVVLFDIRSGDFSERFTRVLRHFSGQESKVYFVFNKADSLSREALTRAYGGVMWQLGRIFQRPEAVRVYFGSFHSAPCNEALAGADGCASFQRDQELVLEAVAALQKDALVDRVNQFELFLGRLEVHIQLVEYLQSQVPTFDSWTWVTKCANVDVNGRELVDGRLTEIVAQATKRFGWNKLVLPDIQRMVKHIQQAGGVCSMKPVRAGAFRQPLERARDLLRDLHQKISKVSGKPWSPPAWAQKAEVIRGGEPIDPTDPSPTELGEL